MPVVGPMSFDACMARDWPGIRDKEAFCATMERGELGKSGWPNHKRTIKIKCEKILCKQEEKRLVTAIASIVTKTDGTPIVDYDGEVIRIDELERAFIEAFADGGLKQGGEMHEKIGGADIVQHFTLSRDERLALGFGEGPEMGIVKLRVTDDELWAKIKAGALPEMSIAGEAQKVPMNG